MTVTILSESRRYHLQTYLAVLESTRYLDINYIYRRERFYFCFRDCILVIFREKDEKTNIYKNFSKLEHDFKSSKIDNENLSHKYQK